MKAQFNVENCMAILAQNKERLGKARVELKTAREGLAKIKKNKTVAAKKQKQKAASPKRIVAKAKAAQKPKPKAKTGTSASANAPEKPVKVLACTICHRPSFGGPPSTTLKCGCTFHRVCIERWASLGKKRCPTCMEDDDLALYQP